ncbi:MAG: flavodoxin family protein [Dehalococcoidales bacterium]|nr:flavodoxin family protein [Dehalococcoidales bacterium]
MKVLGLSAGRPMGNSEILLKEALLGAEEHGAEGEMIRLQDLSIKPCTGCEACTVSRLKTGANKGCIIKNDHYPFLLDKMAESDGIILSFPSYCFRPPGLVMNIKDRSAGIGDSYFKKAAQKPKVGATIAVAGFTGISLMRTMTNYSFPPGVKLIDQMMVTHTSRPGQVLLNDEAIARAKKLGGNLSLAMKVPFEEARYVGEEYGGCPICHSDLLWVQGKYVQCPTCYIKGTVEIKGDTIRFVFEEKEKQISWHGKPGFSKEHDDALRRNQQIMDENRQEINDKSQKYRAYNKIIAPPPLKEN